MRCTLKRNFCDVGEKGREEGIMSCTRLAAGRLQALSTRCLTAFKKAIGSLYRLVSESVYLYPRLDLTGDIRAPLS